MEFSGPKRARLEAACRIIAELTDACAGDLFEPRGEDPRGRYLADVEAVRKETFKVPSRSRSA